MQIVVCIGCFDQFTKALVDLRDSITILAEQVSEAFANMCKPLIGIEDPFKIREPQNKKRKDTKIYGAYNYIPAFHRNLPYQRRGY